MLGERLWRDLLAPSGPFALGAIVDLGDVQDAGSAPMVEDRRFVPGAARRIRSLGPAAYWRMVSAGTPDRLRAIFGETLQQDGRTASVPANRGSASLGLFAPNEPPELRINDYRQLRMRLADGEMELDTAVNDLRFFDRHNQPIPDVVEDIAERIEQGGCVLSVGLTRLYASTSSEPPRHWLQATASTLPTTRCGRSAGADGLRPPARARGPFEHEVAHLHPGAPARVRLGDEAAVAALGRRLRAQQRHAPLAGDRGVQRADPVALVQQRPEAPLVAFPVAVRAVAVRIPAMRAS